MLFSRKKYGIEKSNISSSKNREREGKNFVSQIKLKKRKKERKTALKDVHIEPSDAIDVNFKLN